MEDLPVGWGIRPRRRLPGPGAVGADDAFVPPEAYQVIVIC